MRYFLALCAIALAALAGTAMASNEATARTSSGVDAQPNPNTGKAPHSWTAGARAAYEVSWFDCRSTGWSDMVWLGGLRPHTPHSRAALGRAARGLTVVSKLYPGGYMPVAIDGCVDGFLKFLKTNRREALR